MDDDRALHHSLVHGPGHAEGGEEAQCIEVSGLGQNSPGKLRMVFNGDYWRLMVI